MTRNDVIAYIKKTWQLEPDHPFSREYTETAVFRHKDTRKWFALCMQVRADRLGLEGEQLIDVVTVKSDPMLIDGIVFREGFHRAYHMNKRQWLSVELGGQVSAQEICSLIDMSFELTGEKSYDFKNRAIDPASLGRNRCKAII